MTAVAEVQETVSNGLQVAELAVSQLVRHPLNRSRFDDAKMAELQASMREDGVLTLLLVRPLKNRYQIVAGERRWRAAQAIGLPTVPCRIKRMTDEAAAKYIVIENKQKEDLHPLDEARGFVSLIKDHHYDVPRIAKEVGFSERYVHDRIRLLQLIPKLQTLFIEERFSTQHAIILSRLRAEDQQRALGLESKKATAREHEGGLFKTEHTLWNPESDGDRPESLKPVSARELQAWVDEHVRFDPEADAAPDLFPETRQAVTTAQEEEEKVVHITHDHYIQESARDSKERTYGPRSWKRADGRKRSKPCDYAVTGVIVAGPGRGSAFRVCIEKKKCKVHWAAEQREAAQRRKQLGKPATAPKQETPAQVAKREAEAKRRELESRISAETDKRVLDAIEVGAIKLSPELIAVSVAFVAGMAWGDLQARIKKVSGFKGNMQDTVAFGEYLAGQKDSRLLARVAVLGSVSDEAIYEDEARQAVVRMAGIDRDEIEKQVRADLAPKAEASPAKQATGKRKVKKVRAKK